MRAVKTQTRRGGAAPAGAGVARRLTVSAGGRRRVARATSLAPRRARDAEGRWPLGVGLALSIVISLGLWLLIVRVWAMLLG